MTINAEAFVSIETALTDRLQKSLRKLSKGLFTEIGGLVTDGKFQEAKALVQRLDMAPVVEGNKEYIGYVTNVAMLFGASRVTPKPGTSVVGLGYEQVTSEQAVSSLVQLIMHGGTEHLRTVALQLIANAELSYVPVVKAERKRILDPFASFMTDAGDAYLNLSSSLHTSRVASYGFTAEAEALGLEYYQINEQLDNSTCPVCAEMHGKTFKVSDARALLDVVLRVDNVESLKNLQPWPKQDKASVDALKGMSMAELVANHWHIPPFHPRCRGLLSRVGKTPPLVPSGQPAPASYKATKEDFKALGVSFTPVSVSLWNKHSPLSPAEVVARLQGSTVDDLLTRALQSKKSASTGLLGMSASKNISIRMERPAFGAKHPVYQNVQIKTATKSLFISAMEVDSADQASSVMKKYMREVVSLARDMGLSSVSMVAGLDAGSYAWAKYGFAPATATVWASLVGAIKKRIADHNLLDGVSALTRTAVDKALKSNDPYSIFVLSDLLEKNSKGMPVGKALLLNTMWEGSLQLEDKESMARFLAYLGNSK